MGDYRLSLMGLRFAKLALAIGETLVVRDLSSLLTHSTNATHLGSQSVYELNMFFYCIEIVNK